jgi:hypothetical protein
MSDCRCMHATSGIEAHGTKKLGPTGIDGCAAVNHDGSRVPRAAAKPNIVSRPATLLGRCRLGCVFHTT